MNGIKSFFASKTIWGAIIAILGTVLPVLGLNFTAADGQLLLSTIDELMTIGGALFAMYGRVVAKSKISGV